MPDKREIVVKKKDGVRTFDLGLIVTDFGVKGDDSARIKSMVGNIPSCLDPNPKIFTRLGEWQEGIVKPEGERLLIIQYMNQSFQNLTARNDHLKSDRYPLKQFADLCAALKTDGYLRELPELLWKYGISYFEVTDPVSFRLHAGDEYAPRFSCDPYYRELRSRWVDDERSDHSACLVGEQLSK